LVEVKLLHPFHETVLITCVKRLRSVSVKQTLKAQFVFSLMVDRKKCFSGCYAKVQKSFKKQCSEALHAK